MRYRVLGRLVVEDDGRALTVPGPRRQAVLAALLAARGRPVRPDALVDSLWDGDPSRAASGSLQSHVSRLRAVLGTAAVVLDAGGYRLVVHPEDVDLVGFEHLAAQGAAALRDGDPVTAADRLRAALSLWRGEAFEGFADLSLVRAEAAAAEERRLAASEHLCEALLHLRRPDEALHTSTPVVEEHPLREEARRLHALALYGCGRQADALAVLAEGRRVLAEELGLDPGRSLQDLERRILRQDPSLEPPHAPGAEPTGGATAPPEAPGPPRVPAPAAAAAPLPLLCPVLVGRAAEVAALRAARAGAAAGRGGTVVVLGPAGAGKSRLVREVLGTGPAVLPGRAVAAPVPVPFRPLVEAVQRAVRKGDRHPGIGAHRSALAALVPEWHDPAVPPAPLPHLAEGLLRLLRGLAGEHPATLLVEDLHWADDETLAVLEYLADNVADEPVLLVLTSRSDEGPAAQQLVHALEVRRSATVLRLPALAPDDVRAMATACLDGRAPDDVVATVVDRAQGIPLFVEELLAGPVGPGPAVPASFGQAVRARTAALPPRVLQVVQAAAVLGRRFDWRLLAATTGLTAAEVMSGLRAAADVQLLESVGDELQFRHALHRDAVLADLVPPERSALAGAALTSLRLSAPDLPGSSCQQAADLAEEAGDLDAAVPLLAEAGRRAADAGALRTAELLLDRALRHARAAARPDLQEALIDVLARAARCDRVRAVAEDLLARLDLEGDRRRAARVLVGLAEAATAAADHRVARSYLVRARPQLVDPGTVLRADLVLAECDVADRLAGAEQRAAEVAGRARDLGAPALEQRALLLVGRCRREYDLERAEEVFSLVRSRAVADGDRLLAVRALAELGSVDLLRAAAPQRLVTAAEEAEALGAVAIAGVSRLHAAITHYLRAERPEGLARATETADLARRFDLPVLARAARLITAALHALVADLDGVRAALRDGTDGDPEAAAMADGNGWAVAHLGLEQRSEALAALRRARSAADRLSNQSPLRAMAALLEAVESGDEVYAGTPSSHWSAVGPHGLMQATAAVLAGRRGDGRAAREHYDRARAILAPLPWYQHVVARLVAERALADGWADPAGWLEEAAAWLDGHGLPAVAAASRALTGAAPDTVPPVGQEVPLPA